MFLVQAKGVSLRYADKEEGRKLHRIGDSPVIASLTLAGGETLEVAARPEHRSVLAGPFANATMAA